MFVTINQSIDSSGTTINWSSIYPIACHLFIIDFDVTNLYSTSTANAIRYFSHCSPVCTTVKFAVEMHLSGRSCMHYWILRIGWQDRVTFYTSALTWAHDAQVCSPLLRSLMVRVFDSLFERSYAEGIQSLQCATLRHSSRIFKLCLCANISHQKLHRTVLLLLRYFFVFFCFVYWSKQLTRYWLLAECSCARDTTKTKTYHYYDYFLYNIIIWDVILYIAKIK